MMRVDRLMAGKSDKCVCATTQCETAIAHRVGVAFSEVRNFNRFTSNLAKWQLLPLYAHILSRVSHFYRFTANHAANTNIFHRCAARAAAPSHTCMSLCDLGQAPSPCPSPHGPTAPPCEPLRPWHASKCLVVINQVNSLPRPCLVARSLGLFARPFTQALNLVLI